MQHDVRAAARTGIAAYSPDAAAEGFWLWKVQPARESVWGGFVYAVCGKSVGDRTWVVQGVVDRDPTAGNAEVTAVVVSRFPGGWRAWEQLHL